MNQTVHSSGMEAKVESGRASGRRDTYEGTRGPRRTVILRERVCVGSPATQSGPRVFFLPQLYRGGADASVLTVSYF